MVYCWPTLQMFKLNRIAIIGEMSLGLVQEHSVDHAGEDHVYCVEPSKNC